MRLIRYDISSEDDWKSVIGTTQEDFGGVDILVNAAAIHPQGVIESTRWNCGRRSRRSIRTAAFSDASTASKR
jgi:NAD(P)-dependent dehydrogenase (short-subunit alcohol dehydrogenase family)